MSSSSGDPVRAGSERRQDPKAPQPASALDWLWVWPVVVITVVAVAQQFAEWWVAAAAAAALLGLAGGYVAKLARSSGLLIGTALAALLAFLALWLVDAARPDRTAPEPATTSEIDLHGTDLTRVLLNGAQLSKANLRHATLTHAELRGACLRGADLTGASLDRADFTGADVADVTGANTKGAIGFGSRPVPRACR